MSLGTLPRRTTRPALQVQRLPVKFEHNPRRVIARFFDPGGPARIESIVVRVESLSDEQVARTLAPVLEKFSHRHANVAAIFEEHCRRALATLGRPGHMPRNRRLLLGSYFTMEYSVESAALFNPSIVPHRNQENLPAGAVRFILSMRATGEGHLSSIVFRTGVITGDHGIHIDAASPFTQTVRTAAEANFDKAVFSRKLAAIGVNDDDVRLVLHHLDERFSICQLNAALAAVRQCHAEELRDSENLQRIDWLARSNYQLELSREAEAAEVVLFPQSYTERHGIEDLRMVRFTDDDGAVTYYGTCTGFDGYRTLPLLIETRDFLRLGVHTLHGPQARNKGMALFPRRIGGRYAVCGRIDGENLYIMYSDTLHFWEHAELLQTPQRAWEFVQIGNCGSPLETPAGWLLLTHGVGPMRTYCIGAMLLDRDDPLKVLGTLDEPLVMPLEDERDGYVPNVVYTCGAMVHNRHVYIPFATSDSVTRFAYVPLAPLLERLVP